MSARYLIWDFDGTLGYREGMWAETLMELIEAQMPGRSVDRERLLPHLRSGFPWHEWEEWRDPVLNPDDWWNRLDTIFERAFCQGCGIDRRRAALLAKRVREQYPLLERWRVFDDSLPALESLKEQGWRHILLSNHVPELGRILEHLGLTPHFEKVFNSAETGFEKPHPAAFLNVLETLPEGATTVMIGDNPHADVEGAEGVGLPALLVRRSHPEYTCHESLLGIEPALEALCNGAG